MTDSRDLIRRMADELIAIRNAAVNGVAYGPDRALIAEALAYLERPTGVVIGDVRFVPDIRREWNWDCEEWLVTIYMLRGEKRSVIEWARESTQADAEAKAAGMLEAIKSSFAGGVV